MLHFLIYKFYLATKGFSFFMKYAIISDIHSNLEALEKVVERIEQEDIDQVICLGDLVGYGPNPIECTELVHKISKVVLAGNHDHAAVGLADISYFNFYAKKAIEWTTTVLTEKVRKLLSTAQFEKIIEPATYVHSTPNKPVTWDYIVSLDDALQNFKHFENQVCFIGHSHVPLILELNSHEYCKLLRTSSLTLEPDKKYIINIGSVGQPRDRDNRACLGIFNDTTMQFDLIRVEYPYKTTQTKIRNLGFPAFLADRLEKGI